ncbi:MAG: glycerophosphodiester phosphodiesterase family protein [Pseudomonadales bacterium]|nr:glycerophosphodiester phosphodiesterase family protein [Pseudomonadales bacterium]
MTRTTFTVFFLTGLFVQPLFAAELIDLYSAASIESHSPVVIGHRGGAVVEGIPENSLASLRLAAERGYAMVEIDVRATSDGVPVSFHDDELEEHVGVRGSIEAMSYAEVQQLHYLEGEEHRLLSLDESLREASRLQLGVMLDIKSGQDSEAFYQQIRGQLQRYGLTRATVTISRHPNTRRYLSDIVMQRISNETWDRVKAGENIDLSGELWFDWPRYINNEEVAQLKALGAFIAPSINVFHYPEHEHLQRAQEDIERMGQAGVDAYQIDAPYDEFVFAR